MTETVAQLVCRRCGKTRGAGLHSCTEARDPRAHYVSTDSEPMFGYVGHYSDELAAYHMCANCGLAVIERSGQLVTMLTGNHVCYGNWS